MANKQVSLDGEILEKDEESPDIAILKSALQKSIRRGYVEKAMAFAVQLLEKAGWYMTWRRLRIIAVEDVGQADVICAVEALYKQFLEFKGKNGKELSWDAKRCVVAAAFLLASSKKCRIPDEFMELWDIMQKKKDVKPLQNLKELWTAVPDEAFDCHTIQGRKLGRGLQYWYEVSSKCENMTEQYARWREWWQGLMVALVKNKTNKIYANYAKCQQEEKSENKTPATTPPPGE